MRLNDPQKNPVSDSQNLADGALSFTSSFGRNFSLNEVSIHFSVAVTETVTITRDSAKGANYDVVLEKRSLVSAQEFSFRPDEPIDFFAGDEIKVQCTNANTTGIAYMELKAKAA